MLKIENMAKENDLMEKIVSLCKRRGFIYPGSEIYGGLANTWDYGPYGAQLKKNIVDAWWHRFVTGRDDMVGMDSAIFMSPKVWEASGHVSNFTDPLVDCMKCRQRFRADLVAEETGVMLDRISSVKCPACGGQLTEPRNFNLLFETHIGPVSQDSKPVYLRGEIAQGMFVNFKNVLDTTRQKLPFGIAQYGKAFRNEITPGNFIFRQLEFNLMEFEYFIAPPKSDAEWQAVFDMWLKEMQAWVRSLGVKDEDIYLHEISAEERAFYSKRTIDIEYQYPFGLKELYGLAYRTDYDLKNHLASGADLRYTDPLTGEKFFPHVIEPTFGIDRTVLATLLSAYREEQIKESAEGESETRVVLALPKALTPIKVAVFPLLKNKPDLVDKARAIYDNLRPQMVCEFDDNGNVGKRYRRQDEIGTPYCVTVDFDTLEDDTVTVRDRDTMQQERVAVADLAAWLNNSLASGI